MRQALISLVILVAAFVGWVFFAPGAVQTLAGYGISLPFGPTSTTAEAAQPPGQQAAPAADGQRPGGQGGQGGRRRPGGQGGANRPATVVTAPVVLATINDSLTAIGEGMAENSVTVTTPSGGTLIGLDVKPGDTLKTGDVIGRLEADAEEIAYSKAQLALKDAADALSRAGELVKSNSVSAVTLNVAQLAYDTANLEVRNADLALKRRTIAAPIGGTVGLMQVTPGNYVGANTAVTTIADTSGILVTFWVPERYVSQISLGMPVQASATALPGQVFDGTISAIDNRIDSASRTLQVQARIPNDAGKMRAGMSFLVTMHFPGEQFPAVDPLAVLWSAEGSYVWAMVDGKAQKVMAKIIQRNSDGVLVDGKLKVGDPVITQGVLQLREGMPVVLLDAPRDPQAAGAGGSRRPAAPPQP